MGSGDVSGQHQTPESHHGTPPDARLSAGIELAELVVKLGRFVPEVVLVAAEDLLTLGGGLDGEFDA